MISNKVLAALIALSVALTGCGNIHSHHDHDHDHDHEHEHVHDHEHNHNHEHEHDHDHDHGHDHSHEDEHVHDHDHEHEHEHEHGNSDEISFSPEKQKLHGIKTTVATVRAFEAVIPASGIVMPSNSAEMTIVAPADGVVYLNARSVEGADVAKGSEIAVISSEGLLSGEISVKVKAEYEAAKAKYLRDSTLLTEEIVTREHFEDSKLRYQVAKSAYASLSGSNSVKGIAVKSGMGGFIRKMIAGNGEHVSEGDAIAVISTQGRKVLRVDVSEKYASAAAKVRSAVVTDSEGRIFDLNNYNGKLIGRARSAEDHYIPVTFEFDSKADILAGSYVDVKLRTSRTAECVVIPVSALTESQGVFTVFVKEDEDCFEKRTVKIGASDGINVEVLSGIEEGEEVVSSGAMIIKLASVAAVPVGHSHNH